MSSNCRCRLRAVLQLSAGRGAPSRKRICARPPKRDALIGTPEEIIGRVKRLQTGGVEYVLLIDVGGSLAALRTFAREVMPEFAD